jgi:hypothetical protein
MGKRKIYEWMLLVLISILIIWWFFGNAAFAVWMTAYKTSPTEIKCYQKIFYADIFIGLSLLGALFYGFVRLKNKPSQANDG